MTPSERFRHNFDGPAWHGPDTNEILAGITATQAVARPIPNAHTIAELVSHMIAWRDFGARMLRGEYEHKIEINGPVDWAPQDGLTDDGWEALKGELRRSQDEILGLLETATDADLDHPAGDRPFSVRVVVDGVVDHDIYHGGQIVMLKKLVKDL